MEVEELPSIFPLYFFDVTLPIYPLKKEKFSSTHLLPHFEDINFSEIFADVSMAWSDDALHFLFDVKTSFNEASYPDYERKDVVELFIQTRPSNLSRYMNKYSHHFLLFPVEVNGCHAMEVTKFRAEDRHELCSPQDISVKVKLEKKRYQLLLELPKTILHGYDPVINKELRIDYYIHRYQNEPQVFFYPQKERSEHHLGLWPKILLSN